MHEISTFQGQGKAIVPGCDAAGTGTKVKRSIVGTRGLDDLNMLATESLSYLTRSNKPYAVSVWFVASSQI